jgi:glyoxylase-like metal-dependent hydrolase (beta-lactamase superfamily II)
MKAGQRFSVGEIECHLIPDGSFTSSPSIPFANAPPEELAAALERSLDEHGLLTTPCNCLLIRAGDELALVDTGLGELATSMGAAAGRLLESLQAVAVRPGEIAHIVISHAHPDHIGGLTRDGKPVFSRARHYIAEAEWSFWTSAESLAQLSPAMAGPAQVHLPPLHEAGLVELVGDGVEPMPGVRLLATPGHTPGHLAVEIGGRAVFLADAVLHEIGFEHPEWTGVMDVHPDLAVETRLQLIGRAADARAVVAGYHLRAAGRVERVDGRYRFRPGV